MNIVIFPFQKTLLYRLEQDTTVEVLSGAPILRTDNHFTKYFKTKTVTVKKGTLFSAYNCANDTVVLKVDTALSNVVASEFNPVQHIGTGKIRDGKEDRLAIFSKFVKHYTGLGYEILTADTDHVDFNRAASRNVLANIFPNSILVLIDGDAFYTQNQVDTAIECAKENDVLYKPTAMYRCDGVTANGYSGYGWVVKASLWPGMDERCLLWGGEDVILQVSDCVIKDALRNGVVEVENHTRDELRNRVHNFHLVKDYKDSLGFPLPKEKILGLLKLHCGYGSYGHFSASL
jgi:hypothetical protein